jgi:hypothetical protein
MAAQGGGVATVLTAGRRCSRRRLGVVGVPGGARVPCSGPAPFSDADGLPFFPRAAVEGGVLGGSTTFPAA